MHFAKLVELSAHSFSLSGTEIQTYAEVLLQISIRESRETVSLEHFTFIVTVKSVIVSLNNNSIEPQESRF